jgi:hypothetical protein
VSARQEPTDPETDELRRVVEGVPGVMSAEVDSDAVGRPTIRVHLDESASEESVLEAVRTVVAEWRRPEAGHKSVVRGRRTGLGKGLDSLLGEAMTAPDPSAIGDATASPADLARVALVRGEHDASVQATDTAGTLAVVFVDAGGVDVAAAASVATLRDAASASVLAATIARIGGHEVATVVLEGPTGDVLVGSAPAGPDRLLAIGLATWRALGP